MIKNKIVHVFSKSNYFLKTKTFNSLTISIFFYFMLHLKTEEDIFTSLLWFDHCSLILQ